MSVAAVILAAGASTRLGDPKQLVELGGERLLERAARICREAGAKPVIVVLGAGAASIMAQCDLHDTQVVRAEHWQQGMSAALGVGVAAASGHTNVVGALLVTADMPFVKASHLMALSRRRDRVCASAYAGRHGVPAYFPRSAFATLQKLSGDAGARDLLQQSASVALPAEDALDVDDAASLAAVRSRFAIAPHGKRGARN